jgi:hypothetical protein
LCEFYFSGLPLHLKQKKKIWEGQNPPHPVVMPNYEYRNDIMTLVCIYTNLHRGTFVILNFKNKDILVTPHLSSFPVIFSLPPIPSDPP